MTEEGGVIWIPEPAWPLLGLGDGGSVECIRSHRVSSISRNHLCHQHSCEPTVLFLLAVSFKYITLWEKVHALWKVSAHYFRVQRVELKNKKHLKIEGKFP